MFWMIIDIFSSFDPASFLYINKSTNLLLLSSFLIISLIQLPYWNLSTRNIIVIISFNNVIYQQLFRTFTNSLKGSSTILSSVFCFIILINLTGLNPYSFSLSRHLIITLSLGLPIWISFILSSFIVSPKATIAHLLPDGAPDWLNPFLILIETTRIFVRPLTLSFRLAANIRAGHIVLGLIRIYRASAFLTSIRIFTLLFSSTIFYIVFEIAICLIQAYIFCLLLSLYSNDHAH